jgi:hypothetical protein
LDKLKKQYDKKLTDLKNFEDIQDYLNDDLNTYIKSDLEKEATSAYDLRS